MIKPALTTDSTINEVDPEQFATVWYSADFVKFADTESDAWIKSTKLVEAER